MQAVKAHVKSTARLREKLLAFYDAHKRDLPWRKVKDPYAIWVSEIMLQQTRVETVIPYYASFLGRFPTVHALAEATEADVLSRWSGLGYYRRARMMHAAAKVVADEHAGAFPKSADALRALPGIGKYTAGAIASIAWDHPEPIVDGNVVRVIARVFGIAREVSPSDAEIWEHAQTLANGARPGDLNQALMELGATVCTPSSPKCDACPLQKDCVAYWEGKTSELPILAKKKAPTLTKLVALLVSRPGSAGSAGAAQLLLRRRSEGLFGGLWEPPIIAAPARGEDLAAKFSAMLGRAVTLDAGVANVRHVLSHKDMRIEVRRGSLAKGAITCALPYEEACFLGPNEHGAIGVSKLCEKILAAKFAEKKTSRKKLR